MSINLTVPSDSTNPELKPRITVVGVGGAGGNAVNNMIRRELEGVDFVVANTDAQSLTQSAAERRIQLGANLTQGLGAGSKPEIGRGAAEEAIDDVLSELDGVHMVFIAAGMGGGTGTGAAPVIARAAREAGILTVGVVTKPFQFEGSHRMKMAEEGILELEQHVDTLIIIPNQNLFRIANENTTFADAFNMADEVLYSGVRGVTDLIVMPGLINLDFADIRTVMGEMGKAMMGTGEASGDRRALDASEAAIANPLLEDMSMKGAKGVLINITGGLDVTLFEVDEAATRIRAEVDADAHIIVGSAFDPNLDGSMRVSVVATGIDANFAQVTAPTMLNISGNHHQPVNHEMTVLELSDEPVAEQAVTVDLAPQADVATEEANESFFGIEGNSTADSTEGSSIEQLIKEIDANSEAVMAMDAPTVSSPVEEEVSAPEQVVADEPTQVSEKAPVSEQPQATQTETIAPAVPTMGATDAFIPPKPVSAGSTAEKPEADPFRAADMANGAHETVAETASPVEPTPKPSLFERVTRTGLAAVGFSDGKSDAGNASEKTVGSGSQGFRPSRESITSLSSVSAPARTAVALDVIKQNEIAGLESQPEPARQETEAEDDMLDIPAFLRRQAN